MARWLPARSLPRFLRLKSWQAEVHDAVVEVLATQVRVTRGRLDLEDAVLDRQHRHIEGAATHVVDQHVALTGTLLVQPVRDRSRGRLVDDAQHVETGDGPRVLGRLALRVVEVRRHGDHRILHRAAEVRLSSLLHLDEDHRRDLLRVELLVLTHVVHLDHRLVARARDHLERPQLAVRHDNLVRALAADQALGVEHRVLRVTSHLVLRRITDQALRVRERNVRRRRAVALVVRDDVHGVVLPDAHARVGRAQVNANSRRLLRHGGYEQRST